jgi:hypothetical protein
VLRVAGQLELWEGGERCLELVGDILQGVCHLDLYPRHADARLHAEQQRSLPPGGTGRHS